MMSRTAAYFTCLLFITALLFGAAAMAANNAGQSFSSWPDTGQTSCSDNGDPISCPKVGQDFYGQDAQYNGTSPSYTVLGGGIMVQDNVTGLIWEVKEAKNGIANYSNPNDADNVYSWCDTNTTTNGGASGNCATNNTEEFVNDLNTANFGGHADWRLPTLKELTTLVNYSRINPTIDIAFFPATVSSFYWSATSYAFNTNSAWLVDFYYGYDDYGLKTHSSSHYSVRAVRTGP